MQQVLVLVLETNIFYEKNYPTQSNFGNIKCPLFPSRRNCIPGQEIIILPCKRSKYSANAKAQKFAEGLPQLTNNSSLRLHLEQSYY